MAIEVAQISGDTVELLFNPDEEELSIGENLSIVDRQDERALIVQVIALKILPLPSHLPPFSGGQRSPRQSPSTATAVAASSRRTKPRSPPRAHASRHMAVAKIRKMIDSNWRPWDGWIPQRHMTVLRLTDHEILQHCVPNAGNPLKLGKTLGGADFGIDGTLLGRLNLIISPQHVGVSPLVMQLLEELIAAGTLCVIFDTQGAYTRFSPDRQFFPMRTPGPSGLVRLVPGENLRLSVQQLGSVGLIALLTRFGLPAAAAMYFARHVTRQYFGADQQEGSAQPSSFLGMPGLLQIAYDLESGGEAIVGGAIVNCLEAIGQTHIIAGDPADTTALVDGYTQLHDGGALVIDLSHLATRARRALVQGLVPLIESYSLSQETLSHQRLPCVFFDEARSIMTRRLLADVSGSERQRNMARFLVTESVADLDTALLQRTEHLFIQRLVSDQEGQHLARSGLIDAETVQTLARRLPGHHSLLIGEMTCGYPIVFAVESAGSERLTDESGGRSEIPTPWLPSPPLPHGGQVAVPDSPIVSDAEPELPLFPEDIPTLISEPATREHQDRSTTDSPSSPTLAQVSATWDYIVKRLSRRRRILETILSTARPIRLTGHCVVLGFPPQQKFQQELIASEDYRRLIEEELKKAFGAELEVTTELYPA